jgi:hypothetical protein
MPEYVALQTLQRMEKPEVQDPTLSSIEQKALSFFMPNKLMQWNQLSNRGNPTKSIDINKLLTYVKKKRLINKEHHNRREDPLKSVNIIYCTVY